MMTIKNVSRLLLVWVCFDFFSFAFAQNPLGQTLQVSTNFRSVIGKPTWLLVVRDIESGQIIPYLFEIREKQNFWIAFTYGRSYRVTISKLVFGPFAEINNFCRLENGIMDGKSIIVTLSGTLTPDPSSFKCYAKPYQDSYFTIVNDHLFK
jgi:hypothetical protein